MSARGLLWGWGASLLIFRLSFFNRGTSDDFSEALHDMEDEDPSDSFPSCNATCFSSLFLKVVSVYGIRPLINLSGCLGPVVSCLRPCY
jgi:hypothetical protein